jgi:hypothetical protein
MIFIKSQESFVGIAKGYRMDNRGSNPGRSKRFFSALQLPDPSSILSNEYCGLFPQG